MRNILITIGLALTVLLAGTFIALSDRTHNLQGDALPSITDSNQSQIISFTELARGSHSKVTMRVNYFITSPTQLKELWQMVDASSTPPAIDFKTHAVIAVFAGQKSTGGNSIEITSVTDTGDVRNIAITLTKPAAGCIASQVLTNPYQIVIMPLSTASLTRTDTEVSTPCN